MLVWGNDSDELAVADHLDAGHRFSARGIERGEPSAERWGPKHLAAEHSRTIKIAGVLVSAGDECASVDFRDRSTGDFPVGRRHRLRVLADGLNEFPAFRQLAEA